MEAENTANNADGDGINWEESVNPELQPLLRRNPFIAWPITIDSKWKAGLNNAIMHIPGFVPRGVKVTKVKGVGAYYSPSKPTEEGAAGRAVLWIHGGGRIMGSASGVPESAACSRIVQRLGVPVLSARYRLATRHPFPAALDDLRGAYEWLAGRIAESEGSDDGASGAAESRIAVGGDSGGAGLAAELCQRILDEGQRAVATASSAEPTAPLPVCQLLIYPMLDDRTCVDASLSKLPPHLTWNFRENAYAWSCYLGPGHEPGDETLPEYASASRRTDLSGLPPAFILVGDLDLFHAECVDYARRLKDDGVETELVEIKGGFHGMMTLPQSDDIRPVVEGWERFLTFAQKSFR